MEKNNYYGIFGCNVLPNKHEYKLIMSGIFTHEELFNVNEQITNWRKQHEQDSGFRLGQH